MLLDISQYNIQHIIITNTYTMLNCISDAHRLYGRYWNYYLRGLSDSLMLFPQSQMPSPLHLENFLPILQIPGSVVLCSLHSHNVLLTLLHVAPTVLWCIFYPFTASILAYPCFHILAYQSTWYRAQETFWKRNIAISFPVSSKIVMCIIDS